MTFEIRLEKPQLEWLQNLMETGIEKAGRLEGGWANHIEHLLAIKEALENADKADRKVATAPRTRRTKEEIETEKKGALCPEHPKRALKQRPSDDCKSCWAAYKRLEPMKYPAAWRAFKAAQKKKGA